MSEVSGSMTEERRSCLELSTATRPNVRAFITGGAGFIGSQVVARLLDDPKTEIVTVYDNFSSGRRANLLFDRESRLRIVEADVGELNSLCRAMEGHDVVLHFASNPDIARAAREPEIDFWQGTVLTQNTLEAARRCSVPRVVYASGSGVYGNAGLTPVHEDHSHLLPISPYGASKLAGEALLCAYTHMFGFQSWVFRFANVVGPHQTHGVLYDFIHKLQADPTCLKILGDGMQSKAYIYADDALSAIWLAQKEAKQPYNCFNVATQDYITVTEIAQIVTRVMGLHGVRFEFTGGPHGWLGDVPVIRWDTSKIRRLGWQPNLTSYQAIEQAARDIIGETITR